MIMFDNFRDVEITIDLNKEVLKEIIKYKNYALLYSKNPIENKMILKWELDENHLIFRGGGISDEEIYILIIAKSKKLFKEILSVAKEIHGIIPTYPTFSELMHFARNKELVIKCQYTESFGGGNAESFMIKKILDDVFAVRKKNDYYMVDDFLDVRVFLRRTESDSVDNLDALLPTDIRDFSVNKSIVDIIMQNLQEFDEKMMFVKYTAVSKRMQAQYLLYRFYSNPLWVKNPVCIMNYRITAYILPGIIDDTYSDKIKQGQIVINNKDNGKYILESIQCNADICHDLTEFNDLISYKCFAITKA